MTITTIPYWKLRRFSARCLAILARYEGTEPVLAAYMMTLGISAKRWNELYDKSLAQRGTRGLEHATGKELIAILRTKLRGWVAMLAPSIDSLDPKEYGDNPNVPEDVISDTEQLLTFVDSWEASNGAKLEFTDLMREDLQQALDAAKASWSTASNAAAARSDLTDELKQAARAFNADLVAFRRTLAAHLGTRHADYQKLRLSKAQTPDEDDDVVDDDMPPADEVSPEEALEDAIAGGTVAEEAAE